MVYEGSKTPVAENDAGRTIAMKGNGSPRRGYLRIERALGFVEFKDFAESWKQLGYDDEDLIDLQNQILIGPRIAPVIPGTGGVRKLRFVSRRERRGKRGGCRVGYVYFEQHGIVVLAIAFAKNVRADFFAWEKKAFKRLVEIWDREFQKGNS